MSVPPLVDIWVLSPFGDCEAALNMSLQRFVWTCFISLDYKPGRGIAGSDSNSVLSCVREELPARGIL